MAVKYIFVTGGVVSGLGKGITAASLGRLLKQRGLRVKVQKLDPYLNVDPGTMSPYQHGEVFVTDDGAETDLDLGHYERFIDENLTVHSSVSSGKVYWNVLNRERTGDYLGATVQIIPHITNEIKRNIYSLDTPDTDVAIVEIGGTVGDIESQPFLESIRQIAAERGRHNVMFLHVSLIVSIPGTGELKSKPTQHSAKELLSLGIQPDVIICRSDAPVPRDILEKISLFCNIPVENAIPNLTAPVLYEVPLMLEREGLADVVVRRLGLICHMPDLTEWATMVHRAKHPQGSVEIALVGKYVALHDAYLSVAEALTHGGIENDVKVNIRWVDSETVTDGNAAELLDGADGVLVPGGFGSRGIEGKIAAVRWARESRVPFLGICLGMQMLFDESDEFGRHRGLGLIPGRVERIPGVDTDGAPQRVPHVGWAPVLPPQKRGGSFRGTVFEDVPPGGELYFVHSYEAKPAYDAHRLADTVYGGRRLCAAAQKGSVIGCQFHPEKSGKLGLSVIHRYLILCEAAH